MIPISEKNKLAVITEFAEEELKTKSKSLYKMFMEKINTNFLTKDELLYMLNKKGAATGTLRDNFISYLMLPYPRKNMFEIACPCFYVLIGIEEGIIQIPCSSFDTDGEAELNLDSAVLLDIEALKEVSNNLKNLQKDFDVLVSRYETDMIINALEKTTEQP